jgi:hypothetical protein
MSERCPSCESDVGGGGKFGVNISGVYDGALFWRCAFCGHDWHRHEDARMRFRAAPYMNQPPDPH